MFGYITKLLIPIASVTRISKEKTVKIIPNAIAVATIDERHVFSSFLSREAAYQLMVGVWKEALPMYNIEVTGSSAQLIFMDASCKNYPTNPTDPKMCSDDIHTAPTSNTLQVHQKKRTSNSGVSELEDESSSAISGNETLSKLLQAGHLTCSQQISHDGSSSNDNPSKGDLSANRDSNSEMDTTLKPFVDTEEPTAEIDTNGLNTNAADDHDKLKSIITLNETPTLKSIFTLKIPRTIHIAYFALSLVIILALVAAFLFYRIAELKSSRYKSFLLDELYKVNEYSASFSFQLNINNFHLFRSEKGTPNVDLYAEVLKWQKDTQAQRIYLTKNVLAGNLEQIAQVWIICGLCFCKILHFFQTKYIKCLV